MATESAVGLSDHMRGVTVTTLACLAGIVAGVASGMFIGTTQQAAMDKTSLLILAALVLVQFPILRLARIKVEDFSGKDYLYVVFMTSTLWFITYTILLSTGVTF